MTEVVYSAEVGANITKLVSIGVALEVAALAEGVDLATAREWVVLGRANKAPYSDFVRELDKAAATAEKKITLNIVKHSNEDWRAAAWLMKNRADSTAETQAAIATPSPSVAEKLTPKMRRFVAEFAVLRNGAAAAREAGYCKKNPLNAKRVAYQLMQRPEIRAAIREREEADERMLGSRKHYVLNRLQDLTERSMQAEPVRDAKGNELGVYKFDGPTAARSLELLGKHEGLFNEKIELRVQAEVEQTLEGIRHLISPQSYADVVRAIAEVAGIEVEGKQGVDPKAAPGDRSDAVH